MKLDALDVVLRERSNAESVDLGFVLARRYAATFWPTYACLIAVLGSLAFVYDFFGLGNGLGAILLWWFKPAYDRIILAVVSRRVFGESQSGWRVLWNPPSGMWRGIGGDLSYRRLSPNRTLLAPVRTLEGLDEQALAKRLEFIKKRSSGSALSAMVLFFNIELLLAFGLALFIPVLFPEQIGTIDWESFLNSSSRGYALLSLAFYFPVIVVEPFFVCVGFSLYLSQRTMVEGWDIELTFRRLLGRLPTILLGLLFASTLVSADVAYAETAPEIRKAVDSVYSDDVFGGYRHEQRWVPAWESMEEDVENPEQTVNAAGALLSGLAAIIPWIAGGLTLIFVALVMFRLKISPSEPEVERGVDSGVQSTLGLDIRPESLPKDPYAASQNLWAMGRYREALSILYRSCLSKAVYELKVDIGRSATEGECLIAVRRDTSNTDFAVIFEGVTEAWQDIAYAHRRIDDDAFVILLEGPRSFFAARGPS